MFVDKDNKKLLLFIIYNTESGTRVEFGDQVVNIGVIFLRLHSNTDTRGMDC